MTDVYFDYKTVRDFLKASGGLLAESKIEYNPGPPNYEGVADTVNEAIVITVGGGPGLELQSMFDRVMVSLDIAGAQNDPDSATAIARAADQRILRLGHTQTIGGVRVLSATRAGGRPTPVSVDDGDRWHLACSYVWRVQSDV